MSENHSKDIKKVPDPLINGIDERAATASGERYRSFIESIYEGVYETDVHGNLTYFNDAFCKVLGHPRQKIEGQNFANFMDEEFARMAYKAFSRIYITRMGFTDLLWEIVDGKGHARKIELSASLITTKKGKKIGFRGIARDVTDRLKAQEALRESESRYQRQYEASRKAEKRLATLLNFVPYPLVVFKLDGTVTYLNPAFTRTFGWSLNELRGKYIPYVPPELEDESNRLTERLFKEKMITRYETKRVTKDGRILDVILKEALVAEGDNEPGSELVILRDISHEKRLARNEETLLRISRALPEYPDLEDLLDFISHVFFQGAALDDHATQKRAKSFRHPAAGTVAGSVIETGNPIIIHDTSSDPNFRSSVDLSRRFKTKNMLQVPLRSKDRIIGVLSAMNKREGHFEQSDIELLDMIAGNVALSIDNAQFSGELKAAYREVTSTSRAKDKVINHLSHELKTPVSILIASLNILEKKLAELPAETWGPTFERARRNLNRILEIQYQVEDIMKDKHFVTPVLLSLLLDQCADELQSMVAEELGEGQIVESIKNRIIDIYGPKGSPASIIEPQPFVENRLAALKELFAHRRIDLVARLDRAPALWIPEDVLRKVVDGLIRNAIENTPDLGKIEITLQKKGDGTELVVRDWGVGITEDHQSRIFEGFFSTQETLSYSSKRPFDFNAGGRGADLLRMKIFAERFHFNISMESTRCRFISEGNGHCPGNIERCSHCNEIDDCYLSGGTAFTVYFPPSSVFDHRSDF
ncbi:MAG: PAS domain S-box protein [Deltaproteobacteria bacterium]|nr:PAS domain S-box protein [Deltaproteobacteria bacterium]